MSRFIREPNLPEGKVSMVICGTDDEHILRFFEGNGITVLKNDLNPYIDSSVSAHADMAALYLGNGIVMIDKNQNKLKKELAESDFYVIEAYDEIKDDYPNDVKLNFTVAGEFVIGNFDYADSRLVELIRDKSKINVKQGYCKCSILVVRDNAIVTDDPSIYRNAVKNGIDSLLISKGDICLDGHGYGFIGGASGKISDDTVVFFGDITKHRDYEKINDFLSLHGCIYTCTDVFQLRDIGGIVSLKESI